MANGNGEVISKYWPLVVAIVGLAVQWGTLYTNQQNNRNNITRIEAQTLAHNQKPMHADAAIAIGVITSQMGDIRDDIGEIKKMMQHERP